MSPRINTTISEPTRVEDFSDRHFDREETFEGAPNGWAKIGDNQFAEVGLDPCSCVVFRSPGTEPAIIGHFYSADGIPRSFQDMIQQAQEVFTDLSKVRVDCFGTSLGHERSERDPEMMKATRLFIESSLASAGFTNIHTHWAPEGNVQDVLVTGGNSKIIEFRQYAPEIDDLTDLSDEYF